jgi:hypothetical protein
MSDMQATTQTGAADFSMPDESAFQSLYDGGAFEPSTNANAASDAEAQRRASESAQQAAQTGRQDDPAANQGSEQDNGEQGQQDGQQAAGEGKEEAPAYSSLDELLTSLKVDPESVKALPVTVKIDGVEKAVPLAEVIKSYQLEGHVNNKSIEVSNQKQALEQTREQWRQATQQALQQHQAMGQLAMQMINHDFQKVDWNTLRASNPAEFAALQAEFQQRQGQVQQFLGQVQQYQAQAQHEQQQAMQQNLAAERKKLHAAIPEWRDPAAFEAALQKISQYARNLGFQDAELNQIYDHRYMRILNDAARYQELQAKAPQVLRKVRQAPPAAAPGSRTNANPSDSRRQAAIDRFNRNPGDEDAQAAVFSLFE